MLGQLLGGALGAIGGLFSGSSQRDADAERARRAEEIARQQAAASKFTPVATANRFATANFGKDAQGNLTSAGYTMSPEMQAYQNQLSSAAPGMLSQFTGSMGATAPMSQGAQSMFSLGQGYLGTSPEAMSQKYMAQQMQLAAPGQQAALDELRARQQATGTSGLSIGGGVAGMQATNPEQAAYWNARLEQERRMAAQADLGGQQYAQFGAGMMNEGANTLQNMYRTQSASYSPFNTALGGMTSIEGLGQDVLNQGMKYGESVSNANRVGAQALAQGLSTAADLQQKSDAYSPWGAMFSGAGQAIGGLSGGDFSSIMGMFGGGSPSSGMTGAGAPSFKAPTQYTVQNTDGTGYSPQSYSIGGLNPNRVTSIFGK